MSVAVRHSIVNKILNPEPTTTEAQARLTRAITAANKIRKAYRMNTKIPDHEACHVANELRELALAMRAALRIKPDKP